MATIPLDPAVANGQALPIGVAAGAFVHIRGARRRIDRVVPHRDCCELHLSQALGAPRVLLWPFDRPAVPIAIAGQLAVVRSRRWLRHIARARRLEPQTPRARAIAADILPYQLEPAIAMASGAARVVLADEVGLGKTVQAGWILADLLERETDPRVLIAVPAGLRRQWTAELASLFAVVPIAVDAGWLRHRIASLPADVSPWTAPGVYLGSIDFLKRPDVAASLTSHPWDLLVVDEAHGAAAPTERYSAIKNVADRARRIVTITATPYSGDGAAFASIIALGATRAASPPLIFRRSREDAGDHRRRRQRLATIAISAEEFRLQRLIERYSRDVWREATGDVEGARLAMTILRKRALSSPTAVARSLKRRLALLQGATSAPRQLTLFDEDEQDDDLQDGALAAPGFADAAREHGLLSALIDAAAQAIPRDSKERYLLRLLRRTPREPAIVFTEYRDTLLQLAAALPAALHLHGGLIAGERAFVQRRFNGDGGVLLATDAASEGLNLQQRCRLVINFELPWNPARLEQRIGRVDRIGQRRPVHAVTLVARDTAEDLVVANLMRRLARVAATLGDRDRLAGMLGDARMARTIIGADAAPLTVDENAAAIPPLPLAECRGAAEQAAIDIRPGRTTARSEPADMACLRDTPYISAMRATRTLPRGCIVVVRCAAEEAGGFVAAERTVALHVPGRHTKPRLAREVRAIAGDVLSRTLPHIAAIVPDLMTWFAEVQEQHRAAIGARRTRELELREAGRPEGLRYGSMELQPGLFDRRAGDEADRRSAIDQRIRLEHDEQLRRLDEAADTLRLATSPSGVLVLWQ